MADLQSAFTTYKSWGRVGDELRWAPWLCRLPEPAKPLPSAADDGEHARKLYSLFARDHAAYVTLGASPPRVSQDQVVVKESYVPEPVPGPLPPLLGRPGDLDRQPGDQDHFYPYSRAKDGTVVRAGRVAGLFVILEKPRGTPGTDDGFVYGTLTPEGEVTSAGKVSSCMGCHVQAPHRRWFGSPGR